MLSIALVLSGFATFDVSIASGYYTLGELAQSLSKQGVSVQASSDCSNDLYVVRADAMDWPEFRGALMADKRLNVYSQNNKWTIARSSADQTMDNNAARRFTGALADSVYQVFSGAAKDTAAYLLGPQEVRERDFEKVSNMKGKDPLVSAKDHLVYLCAMERDILFHEIGAPAYVSSFRNGVETFGKVRISPVANIPGAFLPSGDPRSPQGSFEGMEPETLQKMMVSIDLGGKLCLEPVTATSSFRLITYLRDLFNGEIDIAEPKPITPDRFKFSITEEKLWGKQELALRQERVGATPLLFNDVKTKPSDKPVRLSEALLRWADATGSSLVCYVAPLTDYVLNAEDTSDMRQTVRVVNEGKVNQDWVSALVAERALPTRYRQSVGIAPGLRLSASQAGRVFVFRGEYGHLDAMNSLRDGVPSRFLNALHAGKAPALSEVATHVAGLRLTNIRNSIFPSTYLEFCNPYAFRPFAAALGRSPKLKARVLSLETGYSAKIPFADLEPIALTALMDGMTECAELNDAVSAAVDPVMSLRYIRNTKEPLTFEAARTQEGYVFEVKQNRYVLWRSWLKNVASS